MDNFRRPENVLEKNKIVKRQMDQMLTFSARSLYTEKNQDQKDQLEPLKKHIANVLCLLGPANNITFLNVFWTFLNVLKPFSGQFRTARKRIRNKYKLWKDQMDKILTFLDVFSWTEKNQDQKDQFSTFKKRIGNVLCLLGSCWYNYIVMMCSTWLGTVPVIPWKFGFFPGITWLVKLAWGLEAFLHQAM